MSGVAKIQTRWRLGVSASLILSAVSCAPFCAIAASPQRETACPSTQPDALVGCIAAKMKELEANGSLNDQVILTGGLNNALLELAQADGYGGKPSDLDVLKAKSLTLKNQPAIHADAIRILDAAIASHRDELKSALSTSKLASQYEAGKDIYPLFVKQKLDFLRTRAKFYDGGPFEIAWRLLLISALESEFFLTAGCDSSGECQKAASANPELLQRAIELLDEVLARRTGPKFSYLANREQGINSDRFWRASLLFVLGKKEQMKDTFRELITENKDFQLGATAPGHVYIYKTFHLPQKLVVKPSTDKDDRKIIDIQEQNLLDKYYNPPQLGIYMCAYVAEAGLQGLTDFDEALSSLLPHDFYVIAAASQNGGKIEKLAQAMDKALNDPGRAAERGHLLQRIAGLETDDFATTMQKGTNACKIDVNLLTEVYRGFQLKASVRNITGLAKKGPTLLMFGGQLNSAQADALKNFLNSTILTSAEVRALGADPDVEVNAFTARPRIEQ
jgi:hypothetical protein